MATLQQALSPLSPFATTPTPTPASDSGKVKCQKPGWFLGEIDIEVFPHLKKVFLYMEEEHNVSSGGRLSMMAGRRFKLSELPLGSVDKSTRQCELTGQCYCIDQETGIRDSYMCSSGFYEESRWLVGTVVAPKGAQAPGVWRLVPDKIVQDYDRWKRSRDLSRWVEDMPTN